MVWSENTSWENKVLILIVTIYCKNLHSIKQKENLDILNIEICLHIVLGMIPNYKGKVSK